jgi:hypothetical protein
MNWFKDNRMSIPSRKRGQDEVPDTQGNVCSPWYEEREWAVGPAAQGLSPACVFTSGVTLSQFFVSQHPQTVFWN